MKKTILYIGIYLIGVVCAYGYAKNYTERLNKSKGNIILWSKSDRVEDILLSSLSWVTFVSTGLADLELQASKDTEPASW
jgi:hypothetical protein